MALARTVLTVAPETPRSWLSCPFHLPPRSCPNTSAHCVVVAQTTFLVLPTGLKASLAWPHSTSRSRNHPRPVSRPRWHDTSVPRPSLTRLCHPTEPSGGLAVLRNPRPSGKVEVTNFIVNFRNFPEKSTQINIELSHSSIDSIRDCLFSRTLENPALKSSPGCLH